MGNSNKFSLGKNAILLVEGATGVFSGLAELEDVRDVSLDMSKADQIVISSRASTLRGRKSVGTEIGLTFDYVYDPRGDAVQEDIRDAFLDETDIELAPLSGPLATAGSEGPYGLWSITNHSRSEGLGELIVYSCEATLIELYEWIEDGVCAGTY